MPRHTRRRAGTLLALAASLAASLALPLVAPARADVLPIPALPTDLLGDPFTGAPATSSPLPYQPTAQNPYLSPDGTSSMHNDAYASDAYAGPGPLGRDLAVRSAFSGASECATMAFDRRGRIVGLCGDLLGFQLKIFDATTLAPIGTPLRTTRRDLLALKNPLTDICGGTYFYLGPDRPGGPLDVVTVVTGDRSIWRVRVDAAGFTRLATVPLGGVLPADDCLVATLPDWSGRSFVVTRQGRVVVVDAGGVRSLSLPAGEEIVNSIAGDETGAIYLVTTHALYAVEADAAGAPRVRWREAYDRGSAQKPGQLSQGSGTTPTLIGDDLVVITDNAEPRMNVLFYRRTPGAGDRLLCKVPVFAAGASATENSLVYAGGLPDGRRSVIVENNFGYDGVQSTILGRTTAPGVAKVSIDAAGECRIDWTSDVVSPTPVPKVSLASGLLYLYTKPASTILDDSWYFTALDVRTGEVRWSRRTGNGIQWNNHYASIYLGPDGAAYMPVLTGLIRFADGG